jgi:hypothetical protein
MTAHRDDAPHDSSSKPPGRPRDDQLGKVNAALQCIGNTHGPLWKAVADDARAAPAGPGAGGAGRPEPLEVN